MVYGGTKCIRRDAMKNLGDINFCVQESLNGSGSLALARIDLRNISDFNVSGGHSPVIGATDFEPSSPRVRTALEQKFRC